MQKLYCYVDESGQDDTSRHFIVVVVMMTGHHDSVREQLMSIEEQAKTYGLKWHKTKHDRRMRYLTLVRNADVGAGALYYGIYKKPLPYFFPMSETLEKAIKRTSVGEYTTIVYVDGIDKAIAKKLTNILRFRGIKLSLVRSRRDESEPLIRLADMWAGCIRGALMGGEESLAAFTRARYMAILRTLTRIIKTPSRWSFYEVPWLVIRFLERQFSALRPGLRQGLISL
ncbi:DUF3800 domain-containing protein [Candidatus Uhrbacteria bacterium]|nr:DUF3800 domain-containing protein [Candidatus Uhrbacteria bacterium]